MSDLKNCYDDAPGICLRNKCEHAEMFKDKLYCLNCYKWFDLTPTDKSFTAKHDEGKLQIHLVIIYHLYGNAKYGDPDNWKTVEKWRYVDALLRHLLLYLDDPDGVDEESGIKHYKHAACNMAFICAMEDGSEKPVKVSAIIDAYTQGYSDCAEELKAYESQMKRSE